MTWQLADIDRLLINQNGFWESYCSNDAGNVRGTRSHIIEGNGLGRLHTAYPAGNPGVNNLRCVLRRIAELFPSLDHRTTGAKFGQGNIWQPAMPPDWLPSDCTFATVALGRFTGKNLWKPIGTDRSTLPRLFVFLRHGQVHLALDCLDAVHAAWQHGPHNLWVRRYRNGEDGLLITTAPVCCIHLHQAHPLTIFLQAVYAMLPELSGVPAIYPGLGLPAGGADDNHDHDHDHVTGGLDNEDHAEDSNEPKSDSGTSTDPLTYRMHCKPYEPQPGTSPTTVFETLYDLALEIRTDPNLAAFTNHHTPNHEIAEAQLQNALLSLSTVSPPCNIPWDILRAFTFNFFAGGIKITNRLRNFVFGQILLTHSRYQRGIVVNPIADLMNRLEAKPTQGPTAGTPFANFLTQSDYHHLTILATWLDNFTTPHNPPPGHTSWLDWTIDRQRFWRHHAFPNIINNHLKHDIETLIYLPNGNKRFPRMGFALGANFFADIGLVWFVKPDLHVNGIVRLLGLLAREGDADERNFSALINLTRIEAPIVNANPRFGFLQTIYPAFVPAHIPKPGLYPRQMDRLIYLIGSDNHLLNGNKNQLHSPRRHKLMVERLAQAGFLGAAYWGLI